VDSGPGPGVALPDQAELPRPVLRVLRASAEELQAHAQRLQAIQEDSGRCVWLAMEARSEPGQPGDQGATGSDLSGS
jgi:hypothetical protein